MFVIVGWLLALACVFGVFIAHGGNIGVVLKALPFEMTTIAGAAAGEAGNGLVFELSVRKSGGKADWAGVSMASRMTGIMQPVPGLGDQAMVAPMAASIHALQGDSFLQLSMPGLPGDREKGIAIARAILGRL